MLNGNRSGKWLGNVWSLAIVPARAFFVATIVVTSVGCSDVLGIEDIESCWDAAGFDGRGCYRTGGGCKLTKEQLPNACTESACIPFDNLDRLGLSSPADLPEIPVGSPGNMGGPGMGGPDDCPATDRVVVTGSNAIVPILSYLSAELAGAANPVTVLYQSQSSCNGAAAIIDDVKVAGQFSYWTREEGKLIENKCTLPEQLADIGTCDVFATTCGLEEDPSKTLDAQAPIQAMIFIAPKTSSERAISAEAARLVYGYGGTYDDKFSAAPWTNVDRMQRRNPSSGTQNMIGTFIGVPSADWVGVENTGTSAMIESVKMASPADAAATIGILDVVNGDPTDVRVSLRVLAFQAKDQNCAFHPDSDEGKLDKRNVRDGHYALWGPIHVFSRQNAEMNVNNVVKYLTLDQAPITAGKDADENMSELIKIVAGGSLVPSCAMRVQRISDGGSLLPLVPARSCACYFDQLTTGESTCAPCTADTDCASPDAPRCNFGFCEQQ
ncbi:MAG: hypothetical protein IPM54_20845 [Polyangiaceae bacterium]|nr:hypothetical protein [Polyangiaceae bacterium]